MNYFNALYEIKSDKYEGMPDLATAMSMYS